MAYGQTRTRGLTNRLKHPTIVASKRSINEGMEGRKGRYMEAQTAKPTLPFCLYRLLSCLKYAKMMVTCFVLARMTRMYSTPVSACFFFFFFPSAEQVFISSRIFSFYIFVAGLGGTCKQNIRISVPQEMWDTYSPKDKNKRAGILMFVPPQRYTYGWSWRQQ